MRAGTKLARPEWAEKIAKLREGLQLNQAALARLLHVSPMAVSRWERAVNEPEAGFYIQMGTLAGEPDCWYFWQRAGLPSNELIRSLRRNSPARPSTKAATTGTDEVQRTIPLLNVTASTSGPGDHEPNLEHLPSIAAIVVPRDWIENHLAIKCLYVKGDGMAPLLLNGSIAAVDLSQFDRIRLYGQIVLVWHKDHGLKIHRLQRYGESEVLVSEEKLQAPVLTIDRNWRVLGKIVWWLSRPESA
jgi:phage repressor protein C with HTH and peptisase S24 domain